ncbi:MAG: hypothetical protein WBB82_15385 [Limnothrix sp.]
MSRIVDPILIQTSLIGEGMTPGKMRSKDIGELMTSTEGMIATYVNKKHSEISISDIIIGPRGFGKNGYTLEYEPSLPDITIPAFEEISGCIETGHIQDLPENTIKNILDIRHLSKKRKFNARFFTVDGKRKYLTSINEDIQIPETFMLKGETVVYGKILRVGGAEENPKIMVRLITGSTIHCTCSRKMAIVRQAGQRLYDVVGMKGFAEWNIEDMTIRKFDIKEFTDYEDLPIDDAFDNLRNNIGEAFNHIEDPAAYFSDLRNGTDL